MTNWNEDEGLALEDHAQTPVELNTPPRRRLSSNATLLIGGLVLAAAVGGWYVTTSRLNAATTDPTSTAVIQPAEGTSLQTPVVNTAAGTKAPTISSSRPTTGKGTDSAASGSSGAAGKPPTANTAASSAATGTPIADATSGAVETTTIPSLTPSQTGVIGGTGTAVPPQSSGTASTAGTSPSTASTPNVTATAATGINPVEAETITPNSNPFRPLRVVRTGAAAVGEVTRLPGSVATVPARSLGSSGTTASSSSGTATVSLGSGAIPLPTLSVGGLASNGQTSQSGSQNNGQNVAQGTGTVGLSGALPLPTVSLGGLNGTQTGTRTGNGSTGTGQNTAPVRPALPLPKLSLTIPGLDLGSFGAETPRTGNTGLPGSAGQPTLADGLESIQDDTGNQVTGALNSPSLLTLYGAGTSTDEAQTQAPLDQYVSTHNLTFTAVVLGPINTAIFTRDGSYVVVSTGGTLPDSELRLDQVTSTSATLRLGNDTKILALTKGAP